MTSLWAPPNFRPMPSITVRVHDYAKARAAAGKKIPVLEYSDGTRHALLPTGQHINLDRKHTPGVSGKTIRRQRIRAARLAREAA